MSTLLSTLRSGLSNLRAQLHGANREIERLEGELAHLRESPIRFDCWKARMLASIDAIADQREAALVDRWRQAIGGAQAGNVLNWPLERYAGPVKRDAAPFFGAGIHQGGCILPYDATVSAGLVPGDLLLVQREAVKESFSRIIEGLRPHWPVDSECGPAMNKRIARIEEIDAQLEKLRADRDEAMDLMKEIAGQS